MINVTKAALMYTMYQKFYKTVEILCNFKKNTVTLLTFCEF
jgi:hypothetical protein